MKTSVDISRVRPRSQKVFSAGPIIYWMSRDQRVDDNWALLYAKELADQHQVDLHVIFSLQKNFLHASFKAFQFMLSGLQEVEKQLLEYQINFQVLLGDPSQEVVHYCSFVQAGVLVTDFSPLKIKKLWMQKILQKLPIPIYEVDAHNIVPCWIASPKQEFGAYTFRPKMHKVLPQFLTKFPKNVLKPVSSKKQFKKINWEKIYGELHLDNTKPYSWITSGEKAAHQAVIHFIEHTFDSYAKNRNDPNQDGQSMLSPYLHFGQISAQRIALAISSQRTSLSKKAFLEELIIRKELSDNFCFYNDHYDSFEGFPAWAQKTLKEHKNDTREYVYSYTEFEKGKTHDPLWNAAQMQMVKLGKMHGYLRMYWAKKIFEWTKSAEEAMSYAVQLNDTYELDGRDPNGYVGIAWSIGGVHDRAWFDRPIFGKIRYMSFNGAKSKFDVAAYIQKYS